MPDEASANTPVAANPNGTAQIPKRAEIGQVENSWVESVREARLKEREQICEQMAQGMPLLNAELKILGNQLAFSYANDPKSPVSAGGRWTDLA